MQLANTPEPTTRRRDRFRGVLVGLAVGDALGVPTAFQPPQPEEQRVAEMIGGGWQQRAPGEWTENTETTLCVVESLLNRAVFDPDDIARRLVSWMRSGARDISVHTRHVLTCIEQGMPWEQASRAARALEPGQASSDALVRCAPLALFFAHSPEYVAGLSPVLARITHTHPDCEQACVCLSVALVHLLMGKHRLEAVQEGELACADAPQELRERVRRAGQLPLETAPTGHVLDTMEVAFWSLLNTTTLEEALVSVVNRGGDASASGATTGALVGACYGYTAIPSRWVQSLKDVGRLLDYADRLFDLATHFT
ncbi:MAG: ADP-ribosylglycohydrolase family protein [Chloroherpetonaceae bacterium]|nr:ADP-ribosylglycohydrolase family protein [Chthonomonadaceae bacterium]MDW8209208.1 ADP-ribosylglycohydrolase family protein [Chloroherpetonaceae bacterium]